MVITEYNEQKELAKARKEARHQTELAIASKLLKRGFSITDTADISGLPETTVKELAEKQDTFNMA